MRYTAQKGFAHLELLLILIVIVVIGGAGVLVWHKQKPKNSNTSNSSTTTKAEPNSKDGGGQILKLKSIGFNLDYYNAATNKAGDIEFLHANLFASQIMGDFGQQDPRAPNDSTKRNPQPTFVMPLNVKVQSLVDGVVIKVATLYSGDISIMVASGSNSSYIYETEHVIRPKVKEGDKVKGGQWIADVSPHGSPKDGFGILEIGLLHPIGSQAAHLCPYRYLDSSIKDDIGKKLVALRLAWENYIGQKIYTQAYSVPGCIGEDPVYG